MRVSYRTQAVGDVEVFYREAGPAGAPVVLLLHGYPTSSHMFRDLIPHLAARFRVIAPDLPGFGLTKAPARGAFDYTFDNLARVADGFVRAPAFEQAGEDRHKAGRQRAARDENRQRVGDVEGSGAPTGFRLAAAHPERVTAIISQNGNAYDEGLSDAWTPFQAYWNAPSAQTRDACRAALTPDAVRTQYLTGSDASRVAPDGYELDIAYLARPGQDEIQLDLIYDYRTNVARYPAWHAYLREHRPPLLAVWGRNDLFFLPPGAEAFRRDVPEAQVEFYDAGHFALETHAAEIGARITGFLDDVHRRPRPQR